MSILFSSLLQEGYGSGSSPSFGTVTTDIAYARIVDASTASFDKLSIPSVVDVSANNRKLYNADGQVGIDFAEGYLYDYFGRLSVSYYGRYLNYYDGDNNVQMLRWSNGELVSTGSFIHSGSLNVKDRLSANSGSFNELQIVENTNVNNIYSQYAETNAINVTSGIISVSAVDFEIDNSTTSSYIPTYKDVLATTTSTPSPFSNIFTSGSVDVILNTAGKSNAYWNIKNIMDGTTVNIYSHEGKTIDGVATQSLAYPNSMLVKHFQNQYYIL
jgi:hypothetical protein